MRSSDLASQMAGWMRVLCVEIKDRHVGGWGNRQATGFLGRTLAEIGAGPWFTKFACMDWESGDATIEVAGKCFRAKPGPWSLPCNARAQLVSASRVQELESASLTGKAVLLHRTIAREPIMPKSFVFYNPGHHQRLVALLEQAKPAVIITATGRSPEMAGGAYPFPMFEDGDFNVPSVMVKDVEGMRLARHAGSMARVRSTSRRIRSHGYNIMARIPGAVKTRVVVCAHVDTKPGTPGALDNASGVVVLLGLAALLRARPGRLTTEIVALNGEDYYSMPGQMAYLAENRKAMRWIALVINLDGAGCRGARTAVSLYGADRKLKATVCRLVGARERFTAGPPWVQGDHSLFVYHGRPAMAITSENADWLTRKITHTEKDTIKRVDVGMLAEIARFVHECILRL